MRITFAATFRDGVDAINVAAEQMAKAQLQVASGHRIIVASDDPAGNSAAMSQDAAIARIDAYTKGADAASARLSVADSVLTDMVNQLTVAQTTALSVRGSLTSPSQRDAAVATLQSIRDALVSDLNTQVGGTYLFAGTNSTTAPFTQAAGGTVSAYHGNATTAAIDIATSQSVAASFDASKITQGTDPKDIFVALADLTTAIQAGDGAGVGLGLDAVNRAFTRTITAQTIVGTALNAVDSGREQLTATRTQALTQLTQLRDANMADALSQMTKAQTAYQAAIGAFATMGRQSLMDYLQ